MRKQFIRFKNIPENEISGVYDGDNGRIRDELGCCCYDFIKTDNNYNIILSSLNTGFLQDLEDFIDDFNRNEIPCYLIEADQVGIGTYSEPVVKNIKIIKQLTVNELLPIKPIYRLDNSCLQLQDMDKRLIKSVNDLDNNVFKLLNKHDSGWLNINKMYDIEDIIVYVRRFGKKIKISEYNEKINKYCSILNLYDSIVFELEYYDFDDECICYKFNELPKPLLYIKSFTNTVYKKDDKNKRKWKKFLNKYDKEELYKFLIEYNFPNNI